MSNKDPKRNASGCLDMTAFKAIRHIEQEEYETERFNRLLSTIFYICDLAGFKVEERIVLKDKKSGKVWR